MRISEQYVDYVRFVIVGDPDLAAGHLNHLRTTHEQYCNAAQEQGSYRVKALGADKSGQRRYTFECWGLASSFVVMLDFERWASRLSRFDVCSLSEADDDEIAATYEAATGERAKNRTVHLFQSPSRTKAGGRNAGGTGFAVGSHKSDLRLSLYKRAGEPARFEGQFAGTMLTRAVEACKSARTGSAADTQSWEALVELLVRWRDTRWYQATTLNTPA